MLLDILLDKAGQGEVREARSMSLSSWLLVSPYIGHLDVVSSKLGLPSMESMSSIERRHTKLLVTLCGVSIVWSLSYWRGLLYLLKPL